MMIEFGGSEAETYTRGAHVALRLPLALLGGAHEECIFRDARPAGEAHGVALFESGNLLLGCALQPMGDAPAQSAHALYSRLLRATSGRSLCRVWNYVPEINTVRDGLENYRAFSVGRARAFEEAFGAGYKRTLPAGSAVGCRGHAIAMAFVADRGAPRIFENPEQVPAYEYPSEHGPQSPSFSRATVTTAAGRSLAFISGTAAIKGHATVAPGILAGQLDCTLDNLRLISLATGLGENLGAAAGCERHFKIYLRDEADLAAARARLGQSLLRAGDTAVWLRADLCRDTLMIEIEATVLGPKVP